MFMEVHSSARGLCSSWALSLYVVSLQSFGVFLGKSPVVQWCIYLRGKRNRGKLHRGMCTSQPVLRCWCILSGGRLQPLSPLSTHLEAIGWWPPSSHTGPGLSAWPFQSLISGSLLKGQIRWWCMEEKMMVPLCSELPRDLQCMARYAVLTCWILKNFLQAPAESDKVSLIFPWAHTSLKQQKLERIDVGAFRQTAREGSVGREHKPE